MDQQEKTITVMGYEVNELFAYRMAEDALPVIASTARELVLKGAQEDDVIKGAEATAKAIASGMRQLVSRRNQTQKDQTPSGTGHEVQMGSAREDQQIALSFSVLPPGTQPHCQYLVLNLCGANTQKPTE